MHELVFGKVSDLLSTQRDGTFKIAGGLKDFLGSSVDLVVSNVVPGEPIQVRWRVNLGLLGTAATFFSIRLLIDDHQVFERTGIPVSQASVDAVTAIAPAENQNLQTEIIVIKDPAIARLVYRFGGKTLSAEVRGQNGAAPEFVGSTRFRVVPEPIDGSWWEWRVPAFESIEWKKGYALVGDFVNHSRFAAVSFLRVELSEVRSEDNPQINPCDYFAVQMQSRNAIAAAAPVSFTFSLLQDWKWFVEHVFVITGPINKTFAYAVSFQATDEFGNEYDWQCSARRVRHIGVPKGKRLAAVGAQSAAASAAASAPFLWALASAWYAVAEALGQIAKDPPAPDPRFREPVVVEPIAPPLPGAIAEKLPALSALLQLSLRLIALENARTVVRARLLGARLHGAEDALEFQKERYLEIEHEMIAKAEKLWDVLPEVQKEVDAEPQLDPRNFERLLRGLGRADLVEQIRRGAGDEITLVEISGLSALVRDQDVVELATANGLFLTPFVVSHQQFVEMAQSEREMVLAGETYVPATSRSQPLTEGSSHDLEAILQPGRRRFCQC